MLIRLLLCLVCLGFIGSCIMLLSRYSQRIRNEAGFIGMIHSSQTADQVRSSVTVYGRKSELFGRTLLDISIESEDMFISALHRTASDVQFEDVMTVRFFKDGNEYTSAGDPYSKQLEADAVLELSRLSTVACAGVVTERQFNISAIAFCVPLSGCEYADSLVIFYEVEDVVSATDSLYTEDISNSRATVVCSVGGEVLTILEQNDIRIKEHNNIYEILRGQTNDKATIDGISTLITAGISGSYTVQIGGETNIITISTVRVNSSAPFAIISVYRAADLHDSGYTIISTVIGGLVFFFILLVAVAVYTFVNQRRAEKRMLAAQETDQRIDCPTRIRYERDVTDILARNKATAFAVIVIDIRHFEYISEQLGYDLMTQILLYLKILYSRQLQLDEYLAYLDNGRFAMLMHYREEETLVNRLKSVCTLASAYSEHLHGNYPLNLFGGIYKTERGLTDSVSKMLDLAISAEEALNFPYDFGTFRLYNESLHASNAQTEYIETHMESALQNHEFQVFYQPKYNVNNDRPDGCEALVRWYNPEQNTYMQPGVFLPLFEANRFVIRLDKYVYEQVCIYIEDAIARGQPLYPVSVNVSRITAAEKDFLSYYIALKKKYNIADGFLMIEFTESFSYEDYGMLREIVNTLHKNGFKCSIDDFGSGFSSYNILKELPMDEIKLDRFFIDRGIAPERDLKILSSVINLAKELKMKVTQEGVETADQLSLLRKLGCDVIQGYYYSKPLCQSDYIDFLSSKHIVN